MDNAWAALSQLELNPSTDVSALISSYQLKPHLLDAIVPQSLRLLSDAYLATHSTEPLQTVYVFSRVRGHKTVIQHLPTSADLLEPLLVLLNELSGSGNWQAEYALLLWLASVVLTPFELENLAQNLWSRLYEAATRFLNSSGIQRDAAAVLTARLLTRKREDQDRLLDRFVAEHVDRATENIGLGPLQVLAEVMDRVSSVPSSIYRLMVKVMQVSEEEKESKYYDSMLKCRLWIKIMGRAALRETSDFAEFVVAECFTLLDNKSTRVRMTAAKYIARIAAKLPDEGCEEICTELLTSLDEDVEYASPDYYNGALLALAEIVRRKLLNNPHIFEQLVLNVLEFRGLHFLQERLNTQVGTNVRDAACYVCWSLFRSVPNLDFSLRSRLFASLIALAILDHEVNVRRAAAAALQEGLGRYGQKLNAEESFLMMENINFQTVSLVTSCYMNIAPLFCDRAAFFHHFMKHGVLHSNADMRRLAARAIPNLQSHISVEFMIETLLNDSTPGGGEHGRMLALGSLYTSTKCKHRLADAQRLIRDPGDSDLTSEAVLRLLPIAPERAASIVGAIITEEKYVIEAIKDLCAQLPSTTLYDDVLPVCVRRMSGSITHVACIVAMREAPTAIILEAARLHNPQSRAMAVTRLGIDDDESRAQLVTALNDYSVDDRGDVGGWVREAAITRVMALQPQGVPGIIDALWTMASDSRQKLRELAGTALVELGCVSQLDFESTAGYYYSILKACPECERDIVARGLAASIGGLHSNVTTREGSLRGLVRYYVDDAENWIVQRIMGLDRSTVPKCAEVVRTLGRLIEAGIEVEPWKRVVAIAFNTTLPPRQPETLVLSAIDILAGYADRSTNATDRLVKLVKMHGSSKVRQAAADALFESGIEDEVLETTDWTRDSYRVNAEKLKINT